MSHEPVTLGSRVAYRNRWLRLREDRIRRADGTEGIYGVLERPDFAVVAPWQDGCLTLVEQYRYPAGARLWELPMGMWEQSPGADPAVLAAGELREETGLVAARMVRAGTLWLAPGICSQRGHVFLATELTQGPDAREPTEQDLISRAFPLAEVEAMIRDDQLCDGPTLAAIAILRIKGMI